MQKPALYTAAAIFALVALAHLIRFIADADIVIAGTAVAVWISLPVGVAAAALAVWMAIAARRR
ncbi:MAG: hypothetical protein V3U18_07125 [Alphaproteobacteria bacterium]